MNKEEIRAGLFKVIQKCGVNEANIHNTYLNIDHCTDKVLEWHEKQIASKESAQPKQGEGETELQKVMNELSEWQDKTFPAATSLSKLYHLKEEVLELIDEINSSATPSPKNTSTRREYADCFMLLLGAAKKDGFTANNIIEAIREKHEINKKRKWGKPDKNGVIKHIKGDN